MRDPQSAKSVEGDVQKELKFQQFFKKMNASWGYEDASLSEQEKELLQLRVSGQLSEKEYFERIQGLIK